MFEPCSICKSLRACRNTTVCAETVQVPAFPLPPQGAAPVTGHVTPVERAALNARDYLQGRTDFLHDGDIKLLYNAFCRATGRDPLP